MQLPRADSEFEQELEAAGFGLEAEHGSAYRTARQQYLRQLLADPNQPRHVLGWIKQELNRLTRVEQARQQGRRPPGGSARNLRGVPGLDVGHKLGKHDQHDPKNFRLEDASFNRARPGLARRVGVFHKYREGEAYFEAALEQAAEQMLPDDQLDVPGIPGADNRWFASAGQARKAALNHATQLGSGHRIAHDGNPGRGQPHYHVVDPTGRRVSGHFFYGRKPPRRSFRGRPSREGEMASAAAALEFEFGLERGPVASMFETSLEQELEAAAYELESKPGSPPRRRKSGRRSPQYRCPNCGAFHGAGPRVLCRDCHVKRWGRDVPWPPG
jgi:hypothetical protein